MAEESTTPDLVELTRHFVETWNRRDLDAWMGFFAPDAVWEVPALDTSVEGVAAIRSFGEEWLVAFAEYAVQPEEILDLGNGVVFAATRQTVRPAGSGGGERLQEAWVYAFVWVEGMLVRSTIYRDPDEARAAAERLTEERAQADV
jgi:ketosteroid isomerase-like protein